MDVGNTILASNTGSPPDGSGTSISLDYNPIQNTNGATITNLTTHNIYNQDPKLGLLADLGAPTTTHALRFESPALDAGRNAGFITDQRGLPRPIDDPNTSNAADVDISAYEADPNLRMMALAKIGGCSTVIQHGVWQNLCGG